LLTFNAGMFFTTGRSPTRRGNAHPTIYPYETFQAADGWINVGIANDKFWQLFCKAIDDAVLGEDPRFGTAPLRVQNRGQLQPLLEDILRREPRSHWLELLGTAGIPCGAIRTVGEVCSSEQLLSRGMIADLLHPTAGSVKSIISPVRLDDEPLGDHIAAPLFGQHTDEILTVLGGVQASELETLRQAGVIAAKPVSK
jgi:formyl-CoA transferase